MEQHSLNFNQKIRNGYRWSSQDEFYEEFKNSFIGKRDGWAWLFGLIGAAAAIILEISLIPTLTLPDSVRETYYAWRISALGIYLLVALSFFCGKVWARKGMYAVPVIMVLLFAVFFGSKGNTAAVAGQTIGMSIIPLLIYTLGIRSVSNRAFFRLPISHNEIQKLWLEEYSNRTASWTAWVSLLLPLVLVPVFNAILASIPGVKHLVFPLGGGILLIAAMLVNLRYT